jgi:hypothetical protein
MCVEAAAEAVKLNCRILGVGEMINYKSKKFFWGVWGGSTRV